MEWYWILLIVLGSIALVVLLATIFYYPVFKRLIDIMCALAVFIFLWPLYVVLAILVKTKLGSPIYFKQPRPGKNGKVFTLYKFRSMKMSTPHDMPTHMLKNPEQYITKVGGFCVSSVWMSCRRSGIFLLAI